MQLDRRSFLLCSSSALGGCVLPPDFFGTGTPLMKFGLVSDVHLGGEGKEADLERTLRFFDAQGVDAVMIPGDIAHSGLIREFERLAAVWYAVFPNDRGADGRAVEKLFVSGNHCLDGWAGRWKGWSEARLRSERFNYADNPQRMWRRLFREDWQGIFVRHVKGIPFIGAQWKSEQAPFIKPPIAETVARLAPTFDPRRPFFFFQHNPPAGTCCGQAGDAEVTAALKAWPNAVSISGHVHRSIADDRNVWQGDFTAISAGCLHEALGGLDYRNVNYVWHKPSWTKPMRMAGWIARGGCCSVVEVFADHLVVHRRGVQIDEALGEDWSVPLPAAYGRGFDFTVRANRMVAPEFASGAKAAATFCPKGHPEQARRFAGEPCVAVEFPSAQTPRGVVREYELAARLQNGAELVRTKVLPNGFGLNKARMTEPGVCLFRTRELAGERPVVFSVTARECFGKGGRPIVSAPFSFSETAALKAARRLVWGDEFDGADLDPKKWRFRATMNSTDCLYANDARTYEVKDSKLCLHVRPSPDPAKRCLLARGVATHETMGFKYGYLEMRAKVPFRHGAWPSWWMTATPGLRTCDWMSEIDIFEVFSNRDTVVANLHKWGKWNAATKKSEHVMLPGGEGGSAHVDRAYRLPDPDKLNDEFHVYGYEWTPKEMSFFVDGLRYYTVPIDEDHDYSPAPMKGMAGHHDFHSVIFNNEVFTPGHGWMPKDKELKPENLPIHYEIDWIRLWQKDGEELRLLAK
ncbi:MAG: family 16 glycosylhydrolase [Kiritimatiellia bacterium]